MRVAIVTPVYPPYHGGIGRAAACDARLLRENGVSVDVFTPNYPQHVSTKEENDVIRLKPFFSWGNGAVLFDVIGRLRGYDVIHLHYPFFGTDILVAFAARLFHIPLVITAHMRPKASGILGATFHAYRAVLAPIIFRVAKTMIVSSDDYADDVGLVHAQRVVIPFGVDVQRFSPGNRLSARREFGLPADGPVIVFVGGMDAAHYFKGVEVLLRAVSTMKVVAHVLLVGDGDRRSAFEALAKRLGISDRVHFVGSVSYEMLPDAYRAANLHVLPSVDRSEAFGLVTQEAMATGIPSIVSHLPGVRTLIVSKETGETVEPGNATLLAEVLDFWCRDLSYCDQAGRRARQRAEHVYSDREIARQLHRVYTKAVM